MCRAADSFSAGIRSYALQGVRGTWLSAAGTGGLVVRLEFHQDRTMDGNKILQELRAERSQLEEAIMAIERLAASGQGRRRGRPPKWLVAQKNAQPGAKRRGRTPGKKNMAANIES